jgi:PAS domain S-box-containing protein
VIRVLYVDDEPAILDTCKKILERDGSFTVITALSGKEGLDRIHAGPVDAVVADYLMEDINGLDLLKIIRNEYPDIPFIIFTGKGREDVVIEAFDHGVDFYVQKGGDARSQFAELAHKIEQAVENRQIKKKLAHTEERFYNFLQNFDGVAFQMTPAGRFFLLEGTVEETTGYFRSEFLSGYASLESIVHPDDRQVFGDNLKKLSSVADFRTDTIFRIIRKDGHIRWLHGILHNHCSKTKKIIHIQGSLYDITYLKSAQEELARTEEKWRSIITKAPVIISVIDRKGSFLFINKTHPPKKPADLVGTGAADYLAPGQGEVMENALHRVFSSRETIRFETSIPLGENMTEWLAHQISPISWDGLHDAALAVSVVITERKWLEQTLRDSEEQYRAIVTASGDGIVILGADGRVTFGSPKVYDIFDVPCDQVLAELDVLDFIDPAFHNIAKWRMKQVREGELDAEPFEYLLVKKNGERFRGELVTTPLRDQTGAISGLLVLIRDISRRKPTQQE